jgi:hypothetical protein
MQEKYNLVKNKKNNEGYIAYCKNFGSPSFDGTPRVQEVLSSSYDYNWIMIVEKVKVHSCGKELMRLITLDNNLETNKKREFNPTHMIHTTLEGAIKEAETVYSQAQQKFILDYKEKIDYCLKGFDNKPQNSFTSEYSKELLERKSNIESGLNKLVVYRYSDLEKSLNID